MLSIRRTIRLRRLRALVQKEATLEQTHYVRVYLCNEKFSVSGVSPQIQTENPPGTTSEVQSVYEEGKGSEEKRRYCMIYCKNYF